MLRAWMQRPLAAEFADANQLWFNKPMSTLPVSGEKITESSGNYEQVKLMIEI